MKYRWVFFISAMFLLNQNLWAQYRGALMEIYFGRQPSARAEAMGKSLDLFNSDANASFFNPASIARSEGTSFSTSYASPYYLATKSYFRNFGLVTSFGKFGALAINRFNFNYGEDLPTTDQSGNVTGKYEYNQTITTLNYAKAVMENLVAGVNINLAQVRVYKTYNAWPIDLAVTRYCDIFSNDDLNAQIAFSAAFFNIFKTKMSYKSELDNSTYEDELAQMLKAGVSGRFDYLNHSLIPGLDLLSVILNAEYRSVLNSADRKGIIVGGELALTELLFLRAGYYGETLDTYGSPNNEDQLSEITYGFGLQVPVQELGIATLPLYIQFDYTKLEQPSYTKTISHWDDFKVWNINVIWNMNVFD